MNKYKDHFETIINNVCYISFHYIFVVYTEARSPSDYCNNKLPPIPPKLPVDQNGIIKWDLIPQRYQSSTLTSTKNQEQHTALDLSAIYRRLNIDLNKPAPIEDE